MRIRPPASRTRFRIGFAPYDVLWAAAAPLLALYIRQAYILSDRGWKLTLAYCLVSLAFSLVAFAAFNIQSTMSRYFSIHDAIDVAKAVALGELMTCGVLFSVTRLEGIPRSTPVIHALILVAALIAGRTAIRIADRDRALVARARRPGVRNVILVGANDLSVLYMQALDALAAEQRVVGLVDDDPRAAGRLINGVRVCGACRELDSLIEEFEVHGIHTDRVVIGGDAGLLSDESLEEVQRVCARRAIGLAFVPNLFALGAGPDEPAAADLGPAGAVAGAPAAVSSYFRIKPYADFPIAVLALVGLAPLWILLALLVMADVGTPVFFWQQRIGLHGRNFLMYKFRTLRAPFDRAGARTPEDGRLSPLGAFLRRTHLDEVPQLLNVLVGDMGLIGPRPLVPAEQRLSAAVRLMARPGISGWAQVNGGTLLAPAERETLDEWYIGNASPWLDLRIVLMTLPRVAFGHRRSEAAIEAASTWLARRHEAERPRAGAAYLGAAAPPPP